MEITSNFSKQEDRDMQEQMSWSSIVVLPYQLSADTNLLCRGFTLVHALSVDEHKHSPARMRYSKFVHYTQNYRQAPHRCCCLLAAKIPRLLTRSTIPLDQGLRYILLMCAVSILVGAPRNCSRFVCWYGFH